MASSKPGGPSCGDPYVVLGVEPDSSDADISKAYKRLALKLHPDKQKNLSPADAERVSREFHDVKEARSFLLDPEHREARRKYDARLASERLRRKEDARRESDMNERRKKLRDELQEKERREAMRHKSDNRSNRADRDEEMIERLRREGKERRDRYESQAASEAVRREAKERVARKTALENRQVRLKWSRSRVGTSHSEHSIAKLLSRFGDVEEVELIGGKGNAALVTFADSSSCGPCVAKFADSDEMRATYVGKRKEEEGRRGFMESSSSESKMKVDRDGEKLEDRRLRQAAERERIRRQMEMDDLTESTGPNENKKSMPSKTQQGSSESNKNRATSYPPAFPSDVDDPALSPLEQLEKVEKIVFHNILSPETLQEMQILS